MCDKIKINEFVMCLYISLFFSRIHTFVFLCLAAVHVLQVVLIEDTPGMGPVVIS